MATILNDNIRISAGKPQDAKYLNIANGTYTSSAQACTQIPFPERSIGLFVNINKELWWFKDATTDESLVPFSSPSNNNIISKSYAELKALADGGLLLVGQYYLLNDYQTIYDQPDYVGTTILNAIPKDAVDIVAKTSLTIEGLILQASTNSTLSKNAVSVLYPHDEIEYDLNVSVTEVTGTPCKGLITRRKDTNSNDFPYDIRTVKFKRYETVLGNGVFRNFFDDGTGCASQEFLTFSSTSNGSSMPVNNGLFFGVFFLPNTVFLYNNGGTCVSSPCYENTFSFYCQNNTFDQNGLINSNNFGVFFEESILIGSATYNDFGLATAYLQTNGTFNLNKAQWLLKCTFNGVVQHNEFNFTDTNTFVEFQFNKTNWFLNNTITSSCIGNNFGYKFTVNRITNTFSNNILQSNTHNNDFNGVFNGNRTGETFQDNTISATFEKNNITGEFYSNIVSALFSRNTIGNVFYSNSLLGEFSGNNITASFYSNYFSANCKGNIISGTFHTNGLSGTPIADKFNYNTINGQFYSNPLIGLEFCGNLLTGAFYSNVDFGDYFENNTINTSTFNVTGYGCYGNTFNNFYTNNITCGSFYSNSLVNFTDNIVTSNKFYSNTSTGTSGYTNHCIFNGFMYNNTFSAGTQHIQDCEFICTPFYNNTMGQNSHGNKILGYNVYNNTFGSSFIGNCFQMGGVVNCTFPNGTRMNLFNCYVDTKDFTSVGTAQITGTYSCYIFVNATGGGNTYALQYYDSSNVSQIVTL